MQKLSQPTYHFDDFSLDVGRACLLRNGQEVRLRNKCFEALRYLIENRGRVVAKAELIQAVWPDSFVTDDSLVQCLVEVRQALGDAAHRYIRTVPRRGYLFEAEVIEKAADFPAMTYTEEVEGIKVVIEKETGATPTAGALTDKIKRHKAALIICAALCVAAAGLALGARRLIIGQGPVEPFQEMSIARLTNSGKVVAAAISPDGKYVVYETSEGGKHSVWLRQLVASSSVQIVPPGEGSYHQFRFSRDGSYIYYLKLEKHDPAGALYVLPVLGGSPRKLTANLQSGIALSPDETRYAFVRYVPDQGECALMIANADGSGEQKLAARRLPDNFREPAWSPDGETIACGVESQDASGPYMTVVEVRVADGAEKALTPQRWLHVGQVAWLADGSGLLLVAMDQATKRGQVLRLTYPGGAARRITNDLHDYFTLSLTADASTLVTVQYARLADIWVAPDADTQRATRITPGAGSYYGLCWTPDGKIMYASNASGSHDIWVMEPDGSGNKQLAIDARPYSARAVSVTDRYVVFASDRTGVPHIWRMDSDGDNLKQLTDGAGEVEPRCSPDGQWVVYTSLGAEKLSLWKVSIAGGDPVPITDNLSSSPTISPDGELIACRYREEQANLPSKIAVIPFTGGPPQKLFDIAPAAFRWTVGGEALAYVESRQGISNIWHQPLDGGPAKQVTDFQAERIFEFDYSPDGRRLACLRGKFAGDVVLIRNSP